MAQTATMGSVVNILISKYARKQHFVIDKDKMLH
jgi:hypothetical protein